jgi:BirA family biotin operon repressor/biotin-[acetyl-CoA-carboxylase] ligase
MLTEQTVAEAARAAGILTPACFFPVIGSTNSELARMAEAGAPEWSVVAAGHQEAGKGRLGRSWNSSPGSSLLISFLLRPQLDPQETALVTLAAGAAAALAVQTACGVEARCKWPNDLVVKGRKLGGILVEAEVLEGRLSHAIVGVGMNLIQRRKDFPPELRESATSVVIEGGRPDPEALLRDVLANARRLCDTGQPGFRDETLVAYRGLCDTIGKNVRAATSQGREVEGTAVAVGDSGELVVQTASGPERVVFGEVVHLG